VVRPFSISNYLIFTEPSVCGIKLVRILNVVDLPALFGPNKPKISPYAIP